MAEKRCSGCYDSFSGPWCENCDTWPCKCTEADSAEPQEERDQHA